MGKTTLTLSEKVETFIESLIGFSARFTRTASAVVFRPVSLRNGLSFSLERKIFVAPLTFLIAGCFALSIIVDTYPEGWWVYFNWIWLDQEIAQQLESRGKDLFSLTSIVRAGLPTFIAYLLTATFFSRVIARPGNGRKAAQRLACFAFGLHSLFFAFACLLPILAANVLDSTTSDSLAANRLSYVQFYGVGAIVVFFGFASLISPVILLSVAAEKSTARGLFQYLVLRVLLAVIVFLCGSVLATEVGSIPARFQLSLTPQASVNYQALDEPQFIGQHFGDVSGARFRVMFWNKTDDLAYIDAKDEIIYLSFEDANSNSLTWASDINTEIIDSEGRSLQFLAIPPGEAKAVEFRSIWTVDNPNIILQHSTDNQEAEFSISDMTINIDYDPIDGADFQGGLQYENTSPTITVDPGFFAH